MEYSDYDATGLASAIAKREIGVREAVEAAIARIEKLDLTINAIVMDDFDGALAKAREFDNRRSEVDEVFYGVPFLVKDNNVYIDGFPTTFGAKPLREHRAAQSEIASSWEAAGLITLGKTNLCEFALTFTTEPTWRGATRNPWSLDRTPGGSSGGAAAAVAARFVPMAHANDAGGSIRVPASCCGLFGFKPTRGMVSLAPHDTDGWFGLNHEHVISRSVRDSRAMLRVHGNKAFVTASLDALLPRSSLRIGIIRTGLMGTEADAGCEAALLKAARLISAMGHETREISFPAELNELATVVPLLAAHGIAQTAKMAGMTADEGAAEAFEALSLELLQLAENTSTDSLEAAKQALPKARHLVDTLFEEVDFIMTTTLASELIALGTLTTDGAAYDFQKSFATMIGFGPYTMPFNLSGHPAMSVPLHFSAQGLPIGVQFAGKIGSDGRLFSLANELEQSAPWAHCQPPDFGSESP